LAKAPVISNDKNLASLNYTLLVFIIEMLYKHTTNI